MKTAAHDLLQSRSPDSVVHETLAPFTHGIALASIATTYLDWICHLAASPSKQRDMLEAGVGKWIDWYKFVLDSAAKKCPPCAHAQPHDKRFSNPAWEQAPFSWWSQGFLCTEQWWVEAMTRVPGVSSHHEEMAEFVTRQWLDTFSPSNFVMSNPEVLRYTIACGGSNLVRGALNWQHDVIDLWSQRKPRGTQAFLPGKDVAVTPGKVIYRNHLIELIQYAPLTRTVYPEPILIVPSWIMKFYILDLSPHNSLVKYLVDRGHTVFMISWNNPTRRDRDLSMENYLDMGVMSALRMISSVTGKTRIHAVGYCLGGTLLAIAAAALKRDQNPILATMTLLASELDFEEPGQLGLFIDESQIAYLESVMASQGYLDGRQMAGAFALINSKDLVWSKLVHEYLMGAKTPMTDFRSWNADATRMPCRMQSEYLRKFYLHNDLAEGRFWVGGKPIALKDLRLPIFVVSTEGDHVSPWRSVYKIHWLTDCEITFVLALGGHNVGIVNPPQEKVASRTSYRVAVRVPGDDYVNADAWFSSAEQREGSWWPEWQIWLASRSGGKIAALSEDLALKSSELGDAPGRYVCIA